MPANDIGIDMGTSSCLVYSTGKGLVLKEPTVVVYDKDTEKIKAIGEEAKQMAGHASSNCLESLTAFLSHLQRV